MQIWKFSFEPKIQRKYYCISALAPKSGQIKKISDKVRSVNLEKIIWCPQFFQKMNTGMILCTEDYPSVHFSEESWMP